jgi:(p)ppGpp synthase/HD superfamily hydrolase
MIELAYSIILNSFCDKKDKAGEPYIFHLKRVADNFKDNEKLYTIALLHDLIEDCTEWSIEKLEEYFDLSIFMAVDALTKRKGENYNEYLLRVASNKDATKVKLADLKDNMDLSRIKTPLAKKDIERTLKYHAAYLFLLDRI